MRKNRRRTIVVNKKYQFGLAKLATSIAVVVINVLLIAGYFLPQWVGFELAITQKGALIVAIVELLILSTVWYISLKLSHRFTGPVYAINKVLESIAQGDYSQRVTLREKDELQELADQLNQAISSNQDRLLCIAQKISTLQNSLDQQSVKDAVLDLRDIVDEFTLLEKGCDEEQL